MSYSEVERAAKSAKEMPVTESEKLSMNTIKEQLDVRRMVSNILFLAKKNNIRIMDIEDAAGVSRGYLSRIGNSGKTPSLDVAWKIAKFLNVPVQMLTDAVLEVSDDENDMMAEFVRKLNDLTRKNDIIWVSHGGKNGPPDDRYEKMDLTVTKGEDEVYYINHCQRTDDAFVLNDDIAVYEGAAGDKSLVIIPYKMTLDDGSGYDFIFTWRDGDTYKWQKVFYTSEDASSQVDLLTDELFRNIQQQRKTSKMEPYVRNFISDFLK